MLGIIFLIIVGLILIVAELIFVPGTTFVGVIGLLCVICGIFLVFDDYGDVAGYWTTAGSLVFTVGAIIYSFQSKSWDKFSLKSVNSSRVNDENAPNLQVGERGETVSDLKPVGKAELAGKLYEVRSLGSWVGTGEKIEIVKLKDKIIYVEPIK